jgi:hypothetical protein
MFADAVKLTSCGVPAAKHGNKNKKNNTHILFTLRFVRSDVGNKLSKRQKGPKNGITRIQLRFLCKILEDSIRF